MSTSLITYIHTVRLLYNWSIQVSWSSFRLRLYMPSSAPISICWSRVSGWIQDAVQWIRSGQPLNTYITNLYQVKKQEMLIHTFEKHAPMWTFGVGGNPLLGGRGGVCLLLCFLGGTGGQATKSGALDSRLILCFDSVPVRTICFLCINIIKPNILPLLLLLSVLELSLSDLCRCPLMFIEFTNPKISSTDEWRRGEPFKAKSSTGLATAWISHFVSESCTGRVALKQMPQLHCVSLW